MNDHTQPRGALEAAVSAGRKVALLVAAYREAAGRYDADVNGKDKQVGWDFLRTREDAINALLAFGEDHLPALLSAVSDDRLAQAERLIAAVVDDQSWRTDDPKLWPALVVFNRGTKHPAGKFNPAPSAGVVEFDPMLIADMLRQFADYLCQDTPGCYKLSCLREQADLIEASVGQAVTAVAPAGAEPVASTEAASALRFVYDHFCGMDNGDEPLEKYPQRAVDALARAGWAVVPYELPFAVLGEAARTGMLETGNPKHIWEWLIAKTRIYPFGLPDASIEVPGRVDTRALSHALNCLGIDAKTNTPDFELAEQLAAQMRMYRGETTHPAPARELVVTEEMVGRFLTWRLPEDFAPDGGISYTPLPRLPEWTHDTRPTGTNLLTAAQARAMLEHVLAREGVRNAP